MKKILLSIAVLLVAQMASATDGQSTGCFDMAVSVAARLGDFGVEGDQHLIKTSGVLCTTEKNMKDQDEDGMVRIGQVTVVVYDGKKAVAQYNMTASSGEGALGTFYNTYARNAEELNVDINDSSANYKVITFVMRNDHIKKGEYAGRVILFGREISLLQR